MTNKQREMFWLVGENNNGKNIVIVKTNTGKACFLQCGFTEEELNKAKRCWKFVEEWEEVKSMIDIHIVQASGCCPYIYNKISEAVYKTWEMWEKEGLINCKGLAD